MTGSLVSEWTVPSAGATAELKLRIVGTEHDGRIVRLQASKCTIGSAPGCTLRLRAPGVQDVNCLILRGPGGLSVKSWAGGTRLNGRVFTDAPLVPGDRLTVGPIDLEILETGVVPPPVAPSPALSLEQQAKLAELERQHQAAQQQQATLVQTLAEREKMLAAAEQRLNTAEALVAELQRETQTEQGPGPETLAEIESLKQQAETLAEQFQSARQSFAEEREAWHAERAEFARQLQEEQQLVQAISAEAEQARRELREIQESLDASRAAWDKERLELQKALADLRKPSAEQIESQRSAKEMEVALMHWREQAEEQVRELSALRARLVELEGTQSNSEEQLKLRSELEAGARELDAETERLLAEQDKFEKQQQQWQVEVEEQTARLESQRGELETLRQAQQEDTARLEGERESLNAERQTWQRQYEQEKADLDARRDDLHASTQSLALARQGVDDERVRLEIERSTLETERTVFAQQQQAWQAEQEAAATALAAAQQQRTAKEAEIADLRQQLDSARSKLTADIESLHIARTELEREREVWHREREAAVEQLAAERERLAHESEQAAHRHGEIAKKLEEIQQIEQRVALDREARDQQREQLAAREAELEVRFAELTTQQQEWAAARQQLDEEREAFVLTQREAADRDAADRDALDNTIAMECERLREQLAEQQQAEQAACAHFAAQLAAWEAERAKLCAELSSHEHGSEVPSSQASLDNERKQIQELANSVEEQRVALAKDAAELRALRDELLAEREQMALAREELSAREAELADEREVLAQGQRDLMAERSRVEDQALTLASERQQLVQREEELAGELASRASQVDLVLPDDEREPEGTQEAEAAPYVPTSAAEVISRLSSSGLWKDDVLSDESLAEPSAEPAPEPAWKSLVSQDETASPAAAVEPSAADDDEDSIENYMERLLRRVSGDTEPKRVVASPIIERVPAVEDAPSTPIPSLALSDHPENPFDPSTYRPRSAPEQGEKLQAMRQIANQTARVAIDTSSKRSQLRRVKSLSTLVLVATATAVASLWFATVYGYWLGYIGTLLASGAAVYWGLQVVTVRLKHFGGAKSPKVESEQPAANVSDTLVQPIIPIQPGSETSDTRKPQAEVVGSQSTPEQVDVAIEPSANLAAQDLNGLEAGGEETSIEFSFNMQDTPATEIEVALADSRIDVEANDTDENPATAAEIEELRKVMEGVPSAADGSLPLRDGLSAVADERLTGDEIAPRDECQD